MEEFRQLYNTISDYLTNPIVLYVATGALFSGGVACLYFAGKVIKNMKRKSKLEEGLKQ